MLERQIFNMLGVVTAQMAPLRGVGAQYLMRYQPMQQGRPEERTVWMHRVSNNPRGTAQRTQVPNPDGSGLVRREEQSMEMTIQFTVTQPLDVSPTALTHGDVLNIIRATVQSDDFIKRIGSVTYSGASVLRVQQIRNTPMINDHGQWEDNPSFDLVVKHTDVYVDSQPEISKFEFEVYRVPDPNPQPDIPYNAITTMAGIPLVDHTGAFLISMQAS